MRKHHQIILSADQIALIMSSVRRKSNCRLLVFGLGNDSLFWQKLNQGGITIFLEDNEEWFRKVMKLSNKLNAFLISYQTRIGDWKLLLKDESQLQMHLPGEVSEAQWDTILVDAPMGWGDQAPGRMKSIYIASKLTTDEGDVFVHDCEREVEDTYCNRYLKQGNLRDEITNPIGMLRRYCKN